MGSVVTIPCATLNEVFLDRTSGALREKTYLRYKTERGGAYRDMTFAEFGAQCRAMFRVLQDLGVKRGDRVAVVSESRPEWLVIDFACLALGAITVPMFPTLTWKQIEYIVQNSESRVLVVSNDLQFGKAIKAAPACSDLRHIVILNDSTKLDKPELPQIRIAHLGQLLDLARTHDGHAADFEREARIARSDDTITIIYTSGTTGTPKGVMLTHHNLLSNIYGAIAALPKIDETDTALSFLPLCHAFERVAMYLFFERGFTVGFAESIDTVAENMLEIRPTVMTGVPRFYERIYARLMRMREKMPERKRKIFDWALEIGEENGRFWEGKPVPLRAKLLKPLADKLVLTKIRERTGGRIRFFVSGAAALPAEVGRAFTGFGLPVIEGYGMTEASPIISVNPYNQLRWGMVGHPLPNVEVRIASDGEILTRGPHVMKGYFRDAAATNEVIDSDGWLHTGDVGEFDREGYLRITDRKKHLFVSSGGKNIAPAHVESLIEQSRYVDQIILIGDKRQYCIALIVPDFEAFREIRRERGEQPLSNEELIQQEEVTQVIDLELERLQKELATFERIRRFTLLADPFSVENGMLTPTLKVKRKEVERRYADVIDALYKVRQAERQPDRQTELT